MTTQPWPYEPVAEPPNPVTISAEEAQALPMPLHHVTRDEDGRPSATCDAPVGAACRVACAEDCGAETWPCGGYDYEADTDREPHRMRDGGYCNVILFWDDDLDCCAEVVDDPDLRDYVGPVEAKWDGDTYVWTPAEPVSAAPLSDDNAHTDGAS